MRGMSALQDISLETIYYAPPPSWSNQLIRALESYPFYTPACMTYLPKQASCQTKQTCMAYSYFRIHVEGRKGASA